MEAKASAYRTVTKAYDAATRENDRAMDFLGAQVYRPLSFCMTVPFIRIGWSANQVTWLRIVVVAIAFCLLMLGQYWSMVAGAALCLVNVFLDHVDGNLARVQGPSAFGGFLDEITDILVKVFTPVAVGVGLFVRPDRLLTELDIAAMPILLVGIVTGLVSATRAFLKSEFAYRSAQFAARHGSASAASDDESNPEVEPATASGTPVSVPYIYRTGVSAMLILLPVFAAADLISVYLLLIFASRTLVFPLELAGLVLRAHRSLSADRA